MESVKTPSERSEDLPLVGGDESDLTDKIIFFYKKERKM